MMYSESLSYQPSVFTGLMNHAWSKVALFRDEPRRSVTRGEAVEVQVRSGDYFVTLATTLDGLSRDINSYAVRAELEDIVSDLIHLQDNYTITKNEPTRISS